MFLISTVINYTWVSEKLKLKLNKLVFLCYIVCLFIHLFLLEHLFVEAF